MFERKNQTLKFLSLHPKLKFHFLQIDCTIITSVQASIKREDHVTTLNTKQSRQVEALEATSTLPQLAGPEKTLKPSWLLRFFTEFGVLRDYSCFLEQVYTSADLTVHTGRWLGRKHNSKFNSHVSVRSIMSEYLKFSSSALSFSPPCKSLCFSL